MELNEAIKAIRPLDAVSMVASKERWNQLAKPIHGFGRFEDVFMQIAGIQRSPEVMTQKKALIMMCADNGVVEEGVSQTDSHTTAKLVRRLNHGSTCSAVMAKRAGVDVIPIDIGMAEGVDITCLKEKQGTCNMTKVPAMEKSDAIRAIESGICVAGQCKDKGIHILAAGDIGIGNTTAAAAVAAVLLGESVEAVVGRGSGISCEGFKQKKEAIRQSIKRHNPDKNDILDVLAKVGGLSIAGLAGVYLGGAAYGMPIVMDGYISAVAAFVANQLSPLVGSYVIPSHLSKEPGMKKIMEKLCMTSFLNGDIGMGEGTGAMLFLEMLNMVKEVYDGADTFEDADIVPYEIFGCH